MPHVYATLDELNEAILAGGATKFATESATVKAYKLGIADAVSRRIDYVCHRSAFGSGFGPRIGVNYYDGDGTDTLLLSDDLLSLSAFTVAPGTAQAAVSPVVTTDYYLRSPLGYTTPYRSIVLHGIGTPTTFAPGLRTIACTGTWGYSNTTVTSTTTMASGFAASTTATTFTTSATPLIVPGMTLLVGTEQMYLSALSGTTATVIRGVNGSTAAVHADTSAIAYYTYDARVHDVAIDLFLRRWKAKQAGADGTDGTNEQPGFIRRESEKTIIEKGLSDLLLLGYY
jgi:hypothetical protein